MYIISTVWLKEPVISISGWNHGDCICIIKINKMALGELPSPNRNCAYWSKLFEKPKNGSNIFVGQAVLQVMIKTYKILFWSITKVEINVWPTKMLMPICQFEFSDNLLRDAYIIFQKSVDSFGMENTAFSILVWSSVPPLNNRFKSSLLRRLAL